MKLTTVDNLDSIAQSDTISHYESAHGTFIDTTYQPVQFDTLYNFFDKIASPDSLSRYALPRKNLNRPSVFSNHLLKPTDTQPIEHTTYSSDWITIHLLICIGLIAWVRLYYPKRLNQVFRSFTGSFYFNQLTREGNIFRERISIPLLIIYLVSTSLLIYLLINGVTGLSGLALKGLKMYSAIMLLVLVTWFLKNAVLTFFGVLFRNEVILSEYLLINFIFNMVVGLVMLPVLIMAVYIPSQQVLYSGIIIWALAFIYRLLRELFMGSSFTKFSLFHRILYLCTFEILPLLVLTKLVMSYLT